tara:strand:+ start:101 stop:469 length:369 start_codon:yes stop_codon:yes gene_type:complete
MYKVRFNLGRGKNFMKWKVENTTTKIIYYLDPNTISLTLIYCTLHNNKSQAKKIKLGSNKSVCAWVLCEVIKVNSPDEIKGDKVGYNPRNLPYWEYKNKDVDGKFYKMLKTNSTNLYYDELC